MPDYLAFGPRLKIERAKHHINDLERQIESFMERKPFRLMRRFDPKSNRTSVMIKTDIPIPDELSLITGDAVHNLCAALDLTMFQLARDRSPSPHFIAFPFPKKAEGLAGAIDKAQVKFAGTNVVEAVEALEPYPGGNEILSALHRLDAQDKHRLLILSRHIPQMSADELGRVSGLPIAGPGILVFCGPENESLVNINGGFGNRRDRLILAKKRGIWEEETNIQPSFFIAFEKGLPFEHQSVITTLRKCMDAVNEAVNFLIAASNRPGNIFPQ